MHARTHSTFFSSCPARLIFFFFFFNDTATTEIYTLSLHDALPISELVNMYGITEITVHATAATLAPGATGSPIGTVDRKSTRLNSSHGYISYAVFCLKKKKKKQTVINNIKTTAVPCPGRRATSQSR